MRAEDRIIVALDSVKDIREAARLRELRPQWPDDAQ